MIFRFIKLALLASCFTLQAAGSPSRQNERDRLLREAPRLHTDKTWQAILMYHPRTIGAPESLIDSPNFFLAKNGKSDAQAELEAFIAGLFKDYDDPNQSAYCRFPRRYDWLNKQLKIDQKTLPVTSCPNAVEPAKLKRAYISFSSYFLESPASFFGHLFIRFSLDDARGRNNPFLDPIVNFSAFHGDVNYLTYMIGGLAGWFPGQFEILSMHTKVQQYNNHESRDLWEFPLRLSQSQLYEIQLSLQELLPHYSRYYYLSRNCSLILAKLLQSVEPDLYLGPRYRYWSTPADILQKLVEGLGDKSDYIFHHSNRSSYLARYEMLDDKGRKDFAEAIKTESIEGKKFDSEVKEALVLDALLDYIDFDNRLSGPSAPTSHGFLRQQALIKRAENPEKPARIQQIPVNENPSLMLPEQKMGLAYHEQGTHYGMMLNWRPTLRDLMSSSLGFKEYMGMNMFELRLFANESSLEFYSMDILRIDNYQPAIPHKKFINLNFRLSAGHLSGVLANPKGLELEIGVNFAYRLAKINFLTQLHTLWQTTSNRDYGEKVAIIPGVGLLSEVSKRWSLFLLHEFHQPLTSNDAGVFSTSLRSNLLLGKNWEAFLDLKKQEDSLRQTAGLNFYF